MDIINRPFKTNFDRKIPNEEIETMNFVIDRFLRNKKEVDIWTINVTTYATAIKLPERHGKLRENKRENQSK